MWVNSGWAWLPQQGFDPWRQSWHVRRCLYIIALFMSVDFIVHSLNSPNSGASGSTSTPTNKIDLLVAALAKIRASVAYVTLFGSLVYMYGSLLPRLERLQAKVEAWNMSYLDDALALEEALGILLAEYESKNGPDTAQIMQSSGHGKQPAGETGKGTKIKDLEAEITKIELALEAALKEMDSWIKK